MPFFDEFYEPEMPDKGDLQVWTTKDGCDMDLISMETSHLLNCIKYMQNNPNKIYGSSLRIKYMQREIDIRKLLGKD